MKQKVNARERRQAQELRRKGILSPERLTPPAVPQKMMPVPKPSPRKAEEPPALSPEEETREFLDYLDRYGVPSEKEEVPQSGKKKTAVSAIPRLNLEDGMPLVADAVKRLHTGIQEMRVSRVKVVKLIHGYGSTGRGGKIRLGVLEELSDMKRKGLIRDFIPGEDFGPMNAASRRLTDQNRNISRDPDYGRINHGITIVML